MGNGILTNLKLKWQALTLTEKVGAVFDVIATIGGGIIGTDIGKKLSEDHGILGGICIRITTAGLGMAASDIAAKALTESYAEPIGKLADAIKERKAKEEAVNE